jgi:hypothetical protein
MQRIQIISGTILPDQTTILTAIQQILSEIRSNQNQMVRFQQNPRAYLGSKGLCEDIQNELLRDLSFNVTNSGSLSPCMITSIGCVFTDCIITNFKL